MQRNALLVCFDLVFVWACLSHNGKLSSSKSKCKCGMNTAKMRVTLVMRHLMSQRWSPKQSEYDVPVWCVPKWEILVHGDKRMCCTCVQNLDRTLLVTKMVKFTLKRYGSHPWRKSRICRWLKCYAKWQSKRTRLFLRSLDDLERRSCTCTKAPRLQGRLQLVDLYRAS